MKKQITKNLLNAKAPTLKMLSSPKKAITKKTIRYIYTEQDLGDGILHAGVTAALYASMK